MEDQEQKEEFNAIVINLEKRISAVDELLQQSSKNYEEFESKKQSLLSDISSAKTELQKIITAAKTEQKTQFDTLVTQKNQEIKSTSEISKTEINTFKNEVQSKITAFLTEKTTELDKYIEKCESEFKESQGKRDIEHDTLKKEIESLLPKASAVGLSKAFSDEKDAHHKSMSWYRLAFIATIAAMLIMPFLAYWTGMIVSFFESPGKDISLQNFFFSAIRLAALELPLVWLATLMSKKIQQHQRIHEEYVHKYTAAMTFVGMSKEAKENTKLFGEDHIKKLTEGFRDAVYMNPSSTLDKSFNSESPLETVSSLVKDVGSDAIKAMIDTTKR